MHPERLAEDALDAEENIQISADSFVIGMLQMRKALVDGVWNHPSERLGYENDRIKVKSKRTYIAARHLRRWISVRLGPSCERRLRRFTTLANGYCILDVFVR